MASAPADPGRSAPADTTVRVDPTLAVYAARAGDWRARRGPSDLDAASALGRRAVEAGGGPVADLGCGPGWHTAALRSPTRRPIALDAVAEMLDLVPDAAPDALRVRADLGALPFRGGSLGGAWAAKSYVHLRRGDVPLALADLHRSLAVGAPARLLVFAGDDEHVAFDRDDVPGRRFSRWPVDLLGHVLVGAGFDVESLATGAGGRGDHIAAEVTRARTLPDTVGPGMRLLVCGLNPSIYAADHGVGFARPGNRYWPAALAAGIVSRDRDPRDALCDHGVGMTDLVKRSTPRADVLAADEYAAGITRLDALCRWLRPGVVCLVGLAGWRAAVDRRAVAGVQDRTLGERPVYVMPSTSGLNAHARLDDLVDHLRTAAALADAA